MWPFTEGSRLQSAEEKDKNLSDLIVSLLFWALCVFTVRILLRSIVQAPISCSAGYPHRLPCTAVLFYFGVTLLATVDVAHPPCFVFFFFFFFERIVSSLPALLRRTPVSYKPIWAMLLQTHCQPSFPSYFLRIFSEFNIVIKRRNSFAKLGCQIVSPANDWQQARVTPLYEVAVIAHRAA